jgi:hypothetical protein
MKYISKESLKIAEPNHNAGQRPGRNVKQFMSLHHSRACLVLCSHRVDWTALLGLPLEAEGSSE